eukprot:TRINITY_DN6780_c0_g1_i1.p1 TRINITY_DN6780_c0_g1~~TRINITY_DN6780_c0_g1_i1.p1  ORF type:complete len:350 (-),score=96.51 TRINITY_DN6780_c0_g1_i1:61-1110(-)
MITVVTLRRTFTNSSIKSIAVRKNQSNSKMSTVAESSSSEIWWKKLRETSDKAIRVGKLCPIESTVERIESNGIEFILRLATNLKNKPIALAKEGAGPVKKKDEGAFDPFAIENIDADMTVTLSLFGTHNIVLNKFNVLPHHFLMTTKDFEHQSEPLNRSDFKTAWWAIEKFDPLVFYNCGKASGASQPHKHLQALPLPIDPAKPECSFPIEPLLIRNFTEGGSKSEQVFTIKEFPFKTGVVKLDFRNYAGREEEHLKETYDKLCVNLGLNEKQANGEWPSHNVLFTKTWFLIFPRSTDVFTSPDHVEISINSVGMIGTMLVKGEKERRTYKEIGPIRVLQGVCVNYNN